MEIADFKSKIKGRILTPKSEEYDQARTPWLITERQTPKLIVLAENAEDIAQAVRYAKEEGLKVAVMNRGHGIARPADDALLIVVSSMNEVRIDPVRQTAVVEAGAKWGDVLEKAQAEGLAPLMGSSSDVGAVGYTLGGGLGWLSRKYGLAADHVLSFEVVTADGELLRASEVEHEELFWGLRGAGAGLGIVTAMEIRLFPVGTVYAGKLLYPKEAAREVLARYRDWAAGLDDDWTTSVSIQNIPPFPFIPEFLRGKTVVALAGCYAGPAEEGEKEIRSWLDWKPPLANRFGEFPFKEADRISEDPKDPSPGVAGNILLTELSDEVIGKIIKGAVPTQGPSPLVSAEIHPLGGAIARGGGSSAAFSQRSAPFLLSLIGMAPDADAKAAFEGILSSFRQELAPYARAGVYLNSMAGEGKWGRSREAFSPQVLDRLVRLKQEVDPEDRFSFGLDLSSKQP